MKNKMIYKGIEIEVRKSGKFQLFSTVNGTLRIFNTLEQAKNYIDNAEVLESHADAMRD